MGNRAYFGSPDLANMGMVWTTDLTGYTERVVEVAFASQAFAGHAAKVIDKVATDIWDPPASFRLCRRCACRNPMAAKFCRVCGNGTSTLSRDKFFALMPPHATDRTREQDVEYLFPGTMHNRLAAQITRSTKTDPVTMIPVPRKLTIVDRIRKFWKYLNGETAGW